MAAAAFKAILKFLGADNEPISYPCTVSDVNGEFYVFPDGSSETVLTNSHGVLRLIDVVLSAAGTDTSRAQIFVNGRDTGEVILNSANLGTNFSRQYTPLSPMRIQGGSKIKIKQIT